MQCLGLYAREDLIIHDGSVTVLTKSTNTQDVNGIGIRRHHKYFQSLLTFDSDLDPQTQNSSKFQFLERTVNPTIKERPPSKNMHPTPLNPPSTLLSIIQLSLAGNIRSNSTRYGWSSSMSHQPTEYHFTPLFLPKSKTMRQVLGNASAIIKSSRDDGEFVDHMVPIAGSLWKIDVYVFVCVTLWVIV